MSFASLLEGLLAAAAAVSSMFSGEGFRDVLRLSLECFGCSFAVESRLTAVLASALQPKVVFRPPWFGS